MSEPRCPHCSEGVDVEPIYENHRYRGVLTPHQHFRCDSCGTPLVVRQSKALMAMFGPLLVFLIVGAIIGPQSKTLATLLAIIGVAPMLVIGLKFFPSLYDVDLRDE